jgi:hypothetical protein
MMRTLAFAATPSPSLPTSGRVLDRVYGTIVLRPRRRTSLLVGEDGWGVAALAEFAMGGEGGAQRRVRAAIAPSRRKNEGARWTS